jgi:hypothetical protein
MSLPVHEWTQRLDYPAAAIGDLGWLVEVGDPDVVPPVNVNVFGANVLMNVAPVIEAPPRSRRAAVAERLLRLNAERPLVSYALEEDWVVLLWAAVPADHVSFELFAVMLHAIREALLEDLPIVRQLAEPR